MRQRDSSLLSLGFGILMGVGLGYLGSLLVSDPDRKKHKQLLDQKLSQFKDFLNQQDVTKRVTDIFENTSDEALARYRQLSSEFVDNLGNIKSTLGLIDEKDYKQAISRFVTTLKKDGEFDTKQLRKIKKYLESDYKLITKLK